MDASSVMSEQPIAESSIFRIMLSRAQAEQFWATLSSERKDTISSGILCTINRCLDLTGGGLVLQLDAARLDRATTRNIQELIQASKEMRSRAKP
jgi:hypothetical protein